MPVPTVTALNPTQGPTTGGTVVVITGTNFTGATTTTFGGTSAFFIVNSATQITALAPAHAAGSVDVRVTNTDGTSAHTTADQYLFVSLVPTVTAIAPVQGPTTGGTLVTITGTNFTGASGVTFGGTPASFTVNSSTQITAFAPAHSAGTVDIRVTTPDGTSAAVVADQYLYVAAVPTVTAVSPATGGIAGGTTVAITGTNFTGATAVTFGGTAAQFAVNTSTLITAFSPSHVADTVHVQVTTPEGTSSTSAADLFTYS